MRANIIGLIIVGAAFGGWDSQAAGQSAIEEVQGRVRVVPSEFRHNVDVEFLYTQDIEGIYSTTWLGREERSEGLWRDIYFETSEKYVKHGILSFQCFADDANGDPTIGIVEYARGSFGDQTEQSLTIVSYGQRSDWIAGRMDGLTGEDPPYELFVVAHYRFCGDEWVTVDLGTE